jgi:hypothetical protein
MFASLHPEDKEVATARLKKFIDSNAHLPYLFCTSLNLSHIGK